MKYFFVDMGTNTAVQYEWDCQVQIVKCILTESIRTSFIRVHLEYQNFV